MKALNENFDDKKVMNGTEHKSIVLIMMTLLEVLSFGQRSSNGNEYREKTVGQLDVQRNSKLISNHSLQRTIAKKNRCKNRTFIQ